MAPGGPGPLLDHLVVLGGLADVDGQGDDLDAEVVDHPADRDGGVEAAAVGEDDALGHGGCASCLAIGVRQAGQVGAGGWATAAPPASSATTTIRVSSPATVPSTSGGRSGRGRSRPRGRSRAGVRRTTRLPECATSTTQSPNTRRRWSSGARCSVGQLGDGVDGLAAGDPHLDGPEVLEVARHGGLGGRDAVGGEQLDEVGLAGDGVLGEQLGDAVLALGLGVITALLQEEAEEARGRRAGGCGPGGRPGSGRRRPPTRPPPRRGGRAGSA